ncbi:hypothetical protein [Treponema sp.]|uniref:hypothetical protein n=1 Tax=Treponema sp. TaxID=166 RepID=UPI002A81D84B|nr:hypothetical protein [Treponema sp.]MCI6442370.1 hypothetical protein [Spirochaetia bacterium]MDY4132081.1 hypothetical protein [Treponema sp.]
MKKTLIAVAAAAALTTSAFAEITFGAWGRAILVPMASNGDKTVAGQNQSWGGWGRATGLDINGSDAEGKAGFSMSYRNTTNGDATAGDNAHFWIKPFDGLKVIAGKVEYNALRGNACLPGWDVIRSSFEVGEDLLFKNYAGTGALVEYTNDALTVFAAVPLTTAYSSTKDDKNNDEVSNVYARTQAGAMYKIDGTGVVKAQFIGKNKETTVGGSKKMYTGDLEASFELTAVENLWVGLGVTFPIMDKEIGGVNDDSLAVKDGTDMKIALGASYNVTDELTVMANGKVLLAQNYKKENTDDESIKPGMQFAVGANYKIEDGLSFAAEVGYLAERKCGDAKLNESSVFAMAGLNKSVGAANVFCGFEMQTNVKGQANGLAGIKNPKANTEKSTQWAIPVVISLSL